MQKDELQRHVKDSMSGAQRLVSQLTELDDRTFVISVGAFLDESLKGLIKKFLVDDREVAEWVDNGNGALATFSARIKMARAVGLLTSVEYRDLELLRKLRNRAAHVWEDFTLASGPEKGRADSMSEPAYIKPDGAGTRKRLEARCKELLAWIQIMNTWANVPFADGRVAIRRLTEIDVLMKMVPVERD